MHKTLLFHSDPGHGWLEVPGGDLHTLGIRDQITPFSYQDGVNAYLEEDRDAGTFLRAARAAGWEVELNDRYVSGSCFIRDLFSYEP